MTHLWHDLKPGKRIPEKVNVVIEIPMGSKCKYELDKDSGIIRVDRIISSAVYYPGNYGFIPKTIEEDGDALDALILSQVSFSPGTFVETRVIGAMDIIDSGKKDAKIICVPVKDSHYKNIKKIKDLSKGEVEEIKEFFRVYKKLERKKVVVKGTITRKKSLEIINKSVKRYKKKFK